MPGPGTTADFFAGDAAMTITQISRASLLKDAQVRLGPGAAADRARRASTRSSARPASACCKKGKNAEAAADFLAFFTNPDNSAKLAQFFPPPRTVAAQRRDAGQDQPAAQARAAADRSSSTASPPAWSSPSHSGQAELSQTVRARARPAVEARRQRQGGARRRLRARSTPLLAQVKCDHRWSGRGRRRRHASPATCSSPRSCSASIVVRASCRWALVVWYSLHEWNVLADTFTFVGGENYQQLLDDPKLPAVLAATGAVLGRAGGRST